MIPVRLQKSRKRGARLVSPNGAPIVSCSRPSEYGNPYRVGEALGEPYEDSIISSRNDAFQLFLGWITTRPLLSEAKRYRASILKNLPGFNLACWCKLCPKHRAAGKPLNESCPDCAPCHVDVIAEILYPTARTEK